jgi:UDP-N-acetylglucosamine--N-acetylmuramyl-(pentapeptide) pyrophosphoryl-undecaprenol N-acetylglucosamine transferase
MKKNIKIIAFVALLSAALVSFFPKEKIILTGNPVRQDLIAIKYKRTEGVTHFNLDTTKKTILVLGGSLGARRINQLIEKKLEFFEYQNVQLLWQCGKLYFDDYKKHNSENVQVMAFIERMDLVYAAADIVISRAGASSVSELCIVGKPVIFIPSPNVTEDHQTKNAKSVADKNGAILIRESELDATFEPIMSDLIINETRQQELSKNIKKLALPNATNAIVEEIIKLINE